MFKSAQKNNPLLSHRVIQTMSNDILKTIMADVDFLQKLTSAFSEVYTQEKQTSPKVQESDPFGVYKDVLHATYQNQIKLTNNLIKLFETENLDTNRKLSFFAKQYIEMINPQNFPMMNDDVIAKTIETKGKNLIEGYKRWAEDQKQNFLPETVDKSAFVKGENIAASKGDVIYENDFLQLIHYQPINKKVYQTPLLIIPPWINRFYIFDLSPENSFVKWCLDQNIDCYIVSWRNPSDEKTNIAFNDYVDNILKVVDYLDEPLNLLSFCIGGIATLIAMTQLKKDQVKSASFLATPVDFSKMHEMAVFVCKDQLEEIKKESKDKDYFSGEQLYKMFCAMRAKDMYWNNFIKRYYLNEDAIANEFLYWNADTTNLPTKMHLAYLEHLFLKNGFMNKSYKYKNKFVDLKKLKEFNIFCLSTENDHIVPPESAFALKQFCPNAHYVLGGAGHVAGIMNHPRRNKYGYKVLSQKKKIEKDGSWWLHWHDWITPYLGKQACDKKSYHTLEPAPGRYAFS